MAGEQDPPHPSKVNWSGYSDETVKRKKNEKEEKKGEEEVRGKEEEWRVRGRTCRMAEGDNRRSSTYC